MKTNVDVKDAEKIIALFFCMIDSIYGTGVHHIGDGDGIDSMTADDIRNQYEKYGKDYFKTHGIEIS